MTVSSFGTSMSDLLAVCSFIRLHSLAFCLQNKKPSYLYSKNMHMVIYWKSHDYVDNVELCLYRVLLYVDNSVLTIRMY